MELREDASGAGIAITLRPVPTQMDNASTHSPTSIQGNVSVRHHIAVRSAGKKRRRVLGKVRTGCLTCKIRRVKCDEGKPHCQRCIKFGIACDGYVSPSKPSKKVTVTKVKAILPKERPVTSPKLSPKSEILRLSSGHSDLNESDGQCFRLYLDEIATRIRNVFPNSLWERLIPQMSEAEPFIRHALVAIGALVKQTKIKAPQRLVDKEAHLSNYHHALRQYDRSLRGIRKAIANGHHDLRKALITCLLVYCFENMLSHQFSANIHAVNGLMLLYQWTIGRDFASTPETPKIGEDNMLEEDLLEAFNALDLQVLLWVDTRTKTVHAKMKEAQNRIVSSMPPQIGSLKQARQFWNLIMARNHHFIKSVNDCDFEEVKTPRETTAADEELVGEDTTDITQEQRTGQLLFTNPPNIVSQLMEEIMRYRADIDRWIIASAHLFADIASGTNELEIVGSQILQVQAKAYHILLASSVFTTETAYDVFLPEFRDIVTLCEPIVSSLSSSHIAGSSPRFHVDIGIVFALNLVALRCRDYNIRTRALELMMTAGIREGPWDSYGIALPAKWIRDIEMEGLKPGDEIVEEQRAFMGMATVDVVTNNRAILRACQRKKDGSMVVRKAYYIGASGVPEISV